MSGSESVYVLYDGVCRLCNWWVRVLIARDSRQRLQFIPAQLIPDGQIPERVRQIIRDSVVVWYEGKWYERSEAILLILSQLSSPWKYLSYLRWVPRRIRDGVYGVIARNRYPVFGKYDACQLVPPSRAAWFPDPADFEAS